MSELHDNAGASHVLLAAALTGLLALTGCDGDDDVAPQQDGAALACSEKGTKGKVTSSRPLAEMSQAEFTQMCDERKGRVEVHPHCGGVNTCRGFSYDSDADVFTEHTCRAANTCTGFTCVICG